MSMQVAHLGANTARPCMHAYTSCAELASQIVKGYHKKAHGIQLNIHILRVDHEKKLAR